MAAKKKAARAQRGTRRSTLRKKRQAKKFEPLFLWGRRIAVIITVFIVIGWGAAWFFLSSADTDSLNWMKSKTLSVTADAGYRVDNILVEGRKYSDPDILRGLINVKKGDPLFSFDPQEAKKLIEGIGWVKSARVERRLPDTVYIKLNERRPLVLWENNNQLHLIDSDGEFLTQDNLGAFKHLLMIRGKGAPDKAKNLIGLLDAEPDLKSRIDHAQRIDERRWNLHLTDGKQIKLPETDMGLALRNVMLHQEQDNILDKASIAMIDARYQGRLIIRTKLGKVQDYKAGIVDAGVHL